MLGVWIAVGVVVLLLLWFIVTYNRLVSQRNLVQEAWSGIDVQLKRRADLVPNLVETVKGYAGHERETLDRVISARAGLVAAAGARAAGEADDQLERALGSLFAVAEAYPDLKASTNFLELQRELSTLEEDISFARRYYNATVRKFNDMQQQFPTVLIAGLLGFRRGEFFKAEEDEREAPGASFAT